MLYRAFKDKNSMVSASSRQRHCPGTALPGDRFSLRKTHQVSRFEVPSFLSAHNLLDTLSVAMGPLAGLLSYATVASLSHYQDRAI